MKLGVVSTGYAKGYMSSWEHIRDKLTCLDLRLDIEVKKQQLNASDPLEKLRGLVISRSEIDSILEEITASNIEIAPDLGRTRSELLELERSIERREENSLPSELRLRCLSRYFNLSSMEEQVILICFAVEFDIRYEKLYAYLHNDVTHRKATLYLIQRLLCNSDNEKLALRHLFDASMPLRKYFLHFYDDVLMNKGSLLTSPMKLDEKIIDYLMDSDSIDAQLKGIVENYTTYDMLQKNRLHMEASLIRAEAFITGDNQRLRIHRNRIFLLYGPKGAGRKTFVKAVCQRVDKPLIIVDTSKLPTDRDEFYRLIKVSIREAVMRQAAVCYANIEVNAKDEFDNNDKISIIADAYHDAPLIDMVFLTTDESIDCKSYFMNSYTISIEVPYPSIDQSIEFWKEFSCEYPLGTDINAINFAKRFRLTPGQIKKVLAEAMDETQWHSTDGAISIGSLTRACYEEVNQKLGTVAQKVEACYCWKDIVLPQEQMDMLQSICSRVRYKEVVFDQWRFGDKLVRGMGLNVLFSGPPGTGKTMAAEVIAGELGLELYKINLSQVVSKYIGETEKNLDNIFRVFDTSQAILFFDEADALFGKRSEVKDAHDKYANLETAYLLQKMEEYKGISILATNFADNIDPAFLRRINFHIKFPFPDRKHRERIWQVVFPEAAPIDQGIDYDFLAEKIVLSGGNIRNIALAAAFRAASEKAGIRMKHILEAAKLEYGKVDKAWEDE